MKNSHLWKKNELKNNFGNWKRGCSTFLDVECKFRKERDQIRGYESNLYEANSKPSKMVTYLKILTF